MNGILLYLFFTPELKPDLLVETLEELFFCDEDVGSEVCLPFDCFVLPRISRGISSRLDRNGRLVGME